jgi:hypothetical protein
MRPSLATGILKRKVESTRVIKVFFIHILLGVTD